MGALLKSRAKVRGKVRRVNPRSVKKTETKLLSGNEMKTIRALLQEPIVDRAIAVIGDKNEALRWLGTPVRALNYATPISLVATAVGRKAVFSTLDRLEHGVL
jgi:putative toxin-antitoxin system antitoxin component (TIGR02293 family)